MSVISKCTILPFFDWSFSFENFKKISDELFLYLSLLGGKCVPISFSPDAPSIESVMACRTTSASECPSNDFFIGIFNILLEKVDA